MKNRNFIFIIAALCIVSMSACFSSWDGLPKNGIISINFGDDAARDAAAEKEQSGVTYELTLTGPDETPITKIIDGKTVSFTVQPGTWKIEVSRFDGDGELDGAGEIEVEVVAGETTPAAITLPAANGIITINLGKSGAYTITLTSPDKTPITKTIEGSTASFKVQPGTWNIAVQHSEGDIDSTGSAEVKVEAGTPVSRAITVSPINGIITVNLDEDGDYTITLTSPGKTTKTKNITNSKTVTFTKVEPGTWSIAVQRKDGDGALIGIGDATAVTAAGETESETVAISEVTDVSDWDNLAAEFEKIKAGESGVILITQDLTVRDYIEIGNGKNITLLTNKNVTINKGASIENSLFRVVGGSTLTLGSADMQGTITVDGGGNTNRTNNSSLFYVGSTVLKPASGTGSGTLIMNNGVILTNNYATANTDRGGGIVVDNNGTFTMNGGSIHSNSANFGGGGVRVLSGGTFKMNGGTISGNTAPSGGGVYITRGGTFTNNGGTITGNTATTGDNDIYRQY